MAKIKKKEVEEVSNIVPFSERAERNIKDVNPLGMRVLVRLQKSDNQTEAGLYLPEGSKEEQAESVLAEVVEVASAIDEDTEEEANISGIPLGAIVLIAKGAGIILPWDSNLRIVDTAEVLATVEEFRLS